MKEKNKINQQWTKFTTTRLTVQVLSIMITKHWDTIEVAMQ